MDKVENIGLIGYGVIGKAIAKELMKSYYHVFVYDNSESEMILAKKQGCFTCASPQDVSLKTKIILLSLPSSKAILDVVGNEIHGILKSASPGTIIVDTSTVDPETSKINASKCSLKDISYTDSPILGRPEFVGNWTLVVGETSIINNNLKSILLTFASKIVDAGAIGNGNIIKILNNLMFGAINSITCEVLSLCKDQSVDLNLFFDTISKSGAATTSKLFLELGPKIINDDFSTVFSINNLKKDIQLGLDLSKESKSKLTISENVKKLTDLSISNGFGDEDTSAIFKIYQQINDKNSS